MITRGDIRQQLEPGLNTVFGLNYNDQPEQWPDIFETDNSDKAFEEDVLMTGLGLAQITGEGTMLPYDDMSESYTARYDHVTVRLGFRITQEAVEDGLYMNVGKKGARELARSMRTTKETLGANVLNTGFSATGPDGVALFSTAHPLSDGSTLANKLATPADLTETSLENLSILVSNLTDDRGKPVKVMIKKMIIPAELQFDAERILGSDYRTATANNDINAIRSMGVVSEGFCVNHYLTDPDAYFLITDCPDGMKHFTRISMQNGMEGDFDADTLKYKARERYSFGYSDWRGVFGTEGAG